MPAREDMILAKIAVDAEFVTPDQMKKCLKLLKEARGDRTLGSILFALGHINEDELREMEAIRDEYLEQLESSGSAVAPITEDVVEHSAPNDELADLLVSDPKEEDEIPRIPGYKIKSVLGKGAMGTVYKAKQLTLQRPVAIKMLIPEISKNRKFISRFMMEARATAKLSHVNIVQGIDVGEVNGKHYFVMEYVDGVRVGDFLKRGGALDDKRALNIVIQVARALEHAQRFGIVHRDVKPDNIILSRDGVAKLCDLGLAQVRQEAGAKADWAGRVGTPIYMAPEICANRKDIDIRADIYSLGATFYHMVTGRVPFPAQTVEEVMRQHLEVDPTPPAELNPIISTKVNFVIMKMLEKDREERYASPAELLQDLVLISIGATPVQLARSEEVPPAPEAPRGPVGLRRRLVSLRRRRRR